MDIQEIIKDCNTLNDVARKLFNKANYYNREKVKQLFEENGIDWKNWLESKKVKKELYCLNCGEKLKRGQYKFCSSSCSAIYNNKLRKKKKYCLNCGKELKAHQEKYCSFKCQHDYQQKLFLENWKKGNENGLKGLYGISSHIRNYLLKKNNYKCECCGWGEKNVFTNTIPLEIHHKDGNYENNSEDNLQVLCPNCHSLTATFKSHNKVGRKGRNKFN